MRLSGYEKRSPAQLSGGQRQRVALARAIVNRPKVLLLDEPLGALDLKLRQEMQVELKRIQGDVGITFVYVTHDQEEALTMSDRLAVFNRGRIEQVGPPAEVYERPANTFVAGFVGVSNLLERARPPLHDPPREGARWTPRARTCTSRTGHIRDVAYAGMVTRYLVDLDAGGELQVVRQNLETTSADALEQKGRRVRIGWRDEHTFAIENKEEDMRGRGMVAVAIAAVLSLGVGGVRRRGLRRRRAVRSRRRRARRRSPSSARARARST